MSEIRKLFTKRRAILFAATVGILIVGNAVRDGDSASPEDRSVQFDNYQGPGIPIKRNEPVYDNPRFDKLCAITAKAFTLNPGMVARPDGAPIIVFYGADSPGIPLKSNNCDAGMVWMAPEN